MADHLRVDQIIKKHPAEQVAASEIASVMQETACEWKDLAYTSIASRPRAQAPPGLSLRYPIKLGFKVHARSLALENLPEIERISLVVTSPNASRPHDECLFGNSSRRAARFYRV